MHLTHKKFVALVVTVGSVLAATMETGLPELALVARGISVLVTIYWVFEE